MAIQAKATLKSWFLTGKKPTQAQFHDLIDSYIHKSESLDVSNITGLEELLESTVSSTAFNSHIDNDSAHGLDEYAKLDGSRTFTGEVNMDASLTVNGGINIDGGDFIASFQGEFSANFEDLVSVYFGGTAQGTVEFDAFTSVTFTGVSEGAFDVSDFDIVNFGGTGNDAFTISDFTAFNVDTENGDGSIYMATSHFTVSGNPGTFKGIEYNSDYSDEFVDESLVNKKWVVDNFLNLNPSDDQVLDGTAYDLVLNL